MKHFLVKHKHVWWLFFVFLICECIVNPLGNFPLNDDWSYAHSVKVLVEKGIIDIGEWPAMTLATHLVWGALFVKVFGFSFTVLHFSTLASSFICLVFVFLLIKKVSKNVNIAFIAACTVLFNPVYFNLSNTFMTDVNFLTILCVGIYLVVSFFESPNWIKFALIFIISLALVFLRQYGLVLPLCFTFAILFIKDKRWLFLSVAMLLCMVVMLCFNAYESYLKTMLTEKAAYKFSSSFSLSEPAFWERILDHFNKRVGSITFTILFFSFPVSLQIVFFYFKKNSKLFFVTTLFASLVLTHVFYKEVTMQVGNVFLFTSVGAETFYESLKYTEGIDTHSYSEVFTNILVVAKYIFVTGGLMGIILVLAEKARDSDNIRQVSPKAVFYATLIVAYFFLIILTEDLFDRYILPLTVIGILVLASVSRVTEGRDKVSSFIVIILLAYVSVFGTKDYYRIHRIMWDSYHEIASRNKVSPERINAGFEINCWNDGMPSPCYNCLFLEHYDYLIQYKPEIGFTKIDSVEFQRYFPYKKDKIYTFISDSIK